MFSFPILYKIIEKKGKINLSNFNTATLRKASKEYNQPRIKNQKLFLNNNHSFINLSDNNDSFYKINSNEGETKHSYIDYINDIILNLNEQIKIKNIILNKGEIEKLSKDKILDEYNKVIKLISEFEEYIHKILKQIENKFKNESKKKNIDILEYENQINNYKNQVQKISNNLDKEISTNNKNQIIINSQNRLIEKLQQDLIFKDIPDYKIKLSKKINKKINLINNKKQDYPNLINYNNSSSYLNERNKRAVSSRIKGRRVETEGSSALTSFIQKTNSFNSFTSLGNNNTFMKENPPIIISTQENNINL